MELAILNTSIMTSEGVFSLRDISLEEARKLAIDNRDNLLSAVGHQSTADILTTLLGVEIKMNRINFIQEQHQEALVFKLLGRPEEGRILTLSEIEGIGYKFQMLIKIEN
jgi:hypothetical protein